MMYNPMELRGAAGTYICEWRSNMIGDAVIEVSVKEKGLLWSGMRKVKSYDTFKSIASYELMTPDKLHDKYMECVCDYEQKQRRAAERSKYDVKTPPSHSGVIGLICFVLALILITWGVTSCSASRDEYERNKPRPVESKIERFILVSMNPPKHFYVTLKSTVDGRVYDHHYVSKHCNSFRDNKIGDEYNIHTTIMFDPKTGQNFSQLNNLYQTFCG